MADRPNGLELAKRLMAIITVAMNNQQMGRRFEPTDEFIQTLKDTVTWIDAVLGDNILVEGGRLKSRINVADAQAHIETATMLLSGEAIRIQLDGTENKMPNVCTLVWDLERIDAAIGERGASVFAKMAETVQATYVEILAARKALGGP